MSGPAWCRKACQCVDSSSAFPACRRNKLKTASKLTSEYADVQVLPPILQTKTPGAVGPRRPQANGGGGAAGMITNGSSGGVKMIEGAGAGVSG